MAAPTGLQPLQPEDIYRSPTPPPPYMTRRLTPSTSVRLPGRGLHAIERIEINRTVERDGVIYYVLEVYMGASTGGPAPPVHPLPTHIVSVSNVPTTPTDPTPATADAEAHQVAIDVGDQTPTPAYTIQKRFREFEALRDVLSRTFENLHPGECAYCDSFIAFLSCSSMQPGLLVKWTTGPAQRKGILGKFINVAMDLALTSSQELTTAGRAECDGWTLIPQVLETFLREPSSVLTGSQLGSHRSLLGR